MEHSHKTRPDDGKTAHPVIFTIGYAGHDRTSLLALLHANRITAVADIRTFRLSSYWTAFDADSFGPFLRENGIAYVFMGDVMGGKPQDPAFYPDGQLDYALMAQNAAFRSGIERLVAGMAKYRICLMCAEKDPLDCHRTLLLAPALKQAGIDLHHLHGDGRIEAQHDVEQRLIRENGGDAPDLFAGPVDDPAAQYDLAFQRHVKRVAPLARDAIKSRPR